jgi:hypothetical protein
MNYFVENYITNAGLKPLEKIECMKAMDNIWKSLAPITAEAEPSFYDGGENPDSIESAFRNIIFAELYSEAGDSANALDYLEKATQDSLNHIDHMDTTNADGSNYIAWSTPRNLPWLLWEDHLMKPEFDLIRSEERFVKCFETLKANSCELK